MSPPRTACRLAGGLLALTASLAGCVGGSPATPAGRGEAVVYGTDDRQDVYAHPSAPLRSLAHESIVALMRPARLAEQGDGSFTLTPTLTHGEAYDLCSDQRFLDQPTSAFCSGTLVAPDIVVTAGHCVETTSGCLNTRLVFDYLYTADGVLAPLEADDVYSCVEVLARQDGVLDYAYLRLDRAVVGHTPAPLSTGLGTTCRNVVDAQSVTVLGFGSGLPLKIDSGGTVTNPSARGTNFFLTSLDTFGGNSGSGVFNASGELVGVLSSGLPDYATRADAGCDVVNVLQERFGGEQIGHLLPTLVSYCATASAPDTELCALASAACPTDGPDAGVEDAGAGDDAGSSSDQGIMDDANVPMDQGATDGGLGPDQGRGGSRRGCAVSAVPDGPGPWATAPLWLLAALGLRRRARVRPR